MEFKIIEASAGYLRRYISVIPLEKSGKKPAIASWKQYREKPASPEIFKDHDGNLGLITGHNGALNIAAIDIDRTGEGIEQAKQEFVEKNGLMDWELASCQATPSGGRHYFFRVPEGIEISNRVGIIDCVDIRGEGGYVVIAPSEAYSKHTGKLEAYRWLNDIPLHETAELSVEVATAIAQSGKEKPKESDSQKSVPQPTYSTVNTPYGAKALDGCIGEVLAAPEGTRNDTLNTQAFNVGQLIGGMLVAPNDGYFGLIDAALAIGLSEQEAKATIGSGIEAGVKEPRVLDNHPDTDEVPNANSQEWGEPQAFTTKLEPVLQVSEGMIPKVIHEHAKIEARKMDNSPIDFVVMGIIACVSAVIGTTRMIRPKKHDFGWLIAPVLWCIAVGSPSTKKTPALKVGTKLLSLAQDEFDEEHAKACNEVETDKAVNELVIQNKEKDVKAAVKSGDTEKAKALMHEMRELK
ncbi:bifunctional DNA primase/polymerase, partial [Pseudomonadota bacterium]